jgi:Uma2 family endonuclease
MSTPTVESSWIFAQITAEQYDAMPVEQCRGIEIVDGMVRVNPSPLPFHNRLARRLADVIDDSGEPEWCTVLDVDLRLRDAPLLNRGPDVIVYAADTPLDKLIPVAAVLAVVEVVSPGSESADRREKPVEYAEAGIPFYWRVETVAGRPELHTFALDQAADSYQSTGVFSGVVSTHLGFQVKFDLAVL